MTNQQKQRLQFLLLQYMDGHASAAQRRELSGLLEQEKEDGEWHELMEEIFAGETPMENYNEQEWQPMIDELISRNKIKRIPVWRRIAVAASILLIIGVGTYFLFFNKPAKKNVVVQSQEERFKNDVDPGGYKARLTLADGRVIVLDSAADGELTKQGKTAVINKDGQLVYSSESSVNGEVMYNTLSTSKGETYTTVLADGSKVWLNSASSIRYPVAFVGNERKVEITGEAYFEVAKAPSNSPEGGGQGKMPFIVSVNGMNVEVLGTHFNVNAYNDEPIFATTLLEGSVKVASSQAPRNDVILKPGQQAILRQAQDDITVVPNANVEQAVAWKNGVFDCNGLDIGAIMRQVGRWYDVDIKMEEGVTKDKFKGKIPRSVKLTSLLKILELSDVKFTLDGNKITVMR